MAFPNNATDGDVKYVRDIKYTYNDAMKMWQKGNAIRPVRMELGTLTGAGEKCLMHNFANRTLYRITIFARKDASHWQVVDLELNSHFDTMDIIPLSVESRGNYHPIKRLHTGFLSPAYNIWCDWDSGADQVEVYITVRVEGGIDITNTVKPGGTVPDSQVTWSNEIRYDTVWVGTSYDKKWNQPWGFVDKWRFTNLTAPPDVWTAWHHHDVVMIPGRLYNVKSWLYERSRLDYNEGNGMQVVRISDSVGSTSFTVNSSFMNANTYTENYWTLDYMSFDYTGVPIGSEPITKRIQARAKNRDEAGLGIGDGDLFMELVDIGLQ